MNFVSKQYPLNHLTLASAQHSSGGWSPVHDTGRSGDRRGCYESWRCCFSYIPAHTRCARPASSAGAPSPSAAAAPAGPDEWCFFCWLPPRSSAEPSRRFLVCRLDFWKTKRRTRCYSKSALSSAVSLWCAPSHPSCLEMDR